METEVGAISYRCKATASVFVESALELALRTS